MLPIDYTLLQDYPTAPLAVPSRDEGSPQVERWHFECPRIKGWHWLETASQAVGLAPMPSTQWRRNLNATFKFKDAKPKNDQVGRGTLPSDKDAFSSKDVRPVPQLSARSSKSLRTRFLRSGHSLEDSGCTPSMAVCATAQNPAYRQILLESGQTLQAAAPFGPTRT